EHQNLAATERGDLPGGRDAVESGHPDVHQHHVRSQRAHLPDRGIAVRGLTDHGDVVGPVQDHRQSCANRAVVVGQQYPDGHRAPRAAAGPEACSGSWADTIQPRPPGPTRTVPPTASARSRMLISPTPSVADAPILPVASDSSLVTVMSTFPSRCRSISSVWHPGACLTALVSASWAMR